MVQPTQDSSADTSLRRKDRSNIHAVWLSVWIALCALLVAATGFASFTERSRKLVQPANIKADGIVVLTGGPTRIAAAVKLLEQKAASRLLISGVNPSISSAQLRRLVGGDAKLFECCVDLDKRAPDTRGNAIEAARWAAKHKFESLAVVTSDYHILRSMQEFSRAMPEVRLIAFPVSSSDSGKPTKSAKTFRLWVNEYVKYLLAIVRIGNGS